MSQESQLSQAGEPKDKRALSISRAQMLILPLLHRRKQIAFPYPFHNSKDLSSFRKLLNKDWCEGSMGKQKGPLVEAWHAPGHWLPSHPTFPHVVLLWQPWVTSAGHTFLFPQQSEPNIHHSIQQTPCCKPPFLQDVAVGCKAGPVTARVEPSVGSTNPDDRCTARPARLSPPL